MSRPVLYPHVPKRREPLFPRVPKLKPSRWGLSASEAFARAKDYFGITYTHEKAGYILPDGTMLDFSGETRGPLPSRRVAPILGAPGQRELDHREITWAWGEDGPSGIAAMKQMMLWGAIRFSAFHDTIVVNVIRPVTTEQVKEINVALRQQRGAVLVVEVDDTELDQIAFREFTYPFIGWVAFIEQTAERYA